ncbi:hypothetical protein [Lentibacillus amyloliquefaciens]|nr:hypothetical protein [Lentibacillus amyloliquefaciens]
MTLKTDGCYGHRLIFGHTNSGSDEPGAVMTPMVEASLKQMGGEN